MLSRDERWTPAGEGPVVTTFVFRVRNVPAALYKALGGFATNSVNMTKLESYMEGGEFTATQFLADVDGHPERPAACSGRWRSSSSSPAKCAFWASTPRIRTGASRRAGRDRRTAGGSGSS